MNLIHHNFETKCSFYIPHCVNKYFICIFISLFVKHTYTQYSKCLCNFHTFHKFIFVIIVYVGSIFTTFFIYKNTQNLIYMYYLKKKKACVLRSVSGL